MPEQQPSGEVPDVNVNVNVNGQGTQVGSGNTMYNAWSQRQPLDPAALGALNPHVAVDRLQQLSHDELVNFFARSKPGDVSEIIATFFDVDVTRLVTALADISRRKTTALITAAGIHFLHDLPGAAEAIAREAARLRWTEAGPVDAYAFAGGYVRKYRGGRVFWSPSFGTWTTVGAIDDRITADGDYALWGFPAGDQELALPSPFRSAGVWQRFQQGRVYSSGHGTFLVSEGECYEDAGGSAGWLGFPIAEAEGIPGGQIQKFEGGIIYSFTRHERNASAAKLVHAVWRKVVSVLPNDGWLPISKEAAAVSSSSDQRTVQRFSYGPDWRPGHETSVYISDSSGVVVLVAPEIWDYYSKLGAEKSWLGFPLKEAENISGFRSQAFEAGGIHWRHPLQPVAVPAEVAKLAKLHELSYPVSEEQPFGTDGSGRIQFFSDGVVVTLWNGEHQVYRSAPPPSLPAVRKPQSLP
jgi:hypothetical protein